MKDKLFTPSYGFILAANFLLYFGFWLLTPVLPFYLYNGSIQNFNLRVPPHFQQNRLR
jgi:hypothetical protein